MTDRWMEEARKLELAYWDQSFNDDEISYEIFAAALSAAHEAGRLEEREACANMVGAMASEARKSAMARYSFTKAADAIRSREVKP